LPWRSARVPQHLFSRLVNWLSSADSMATSFSVSYTPGFFLVGFVKNWVFIPPLPANVAELRSRFTATVAEVTPEMPHSVWQDIDYRWEVCHIINESHIAP
jgi:hypothetical protein